MNRALEKVLAAQLMTWEELKKAVCTVYVVVVVVLCVCLHVQKSSVWRM